jgi:hypothetical protein
MTPSKGWIYDADKLPLLQKCDGVSLQSVFQEA